MYWWKRGVVVEAGPPSAPAAPGLSVRSGALSSRSQFRNSTANAAPCSRSRASSSAGYLFINSFVVLLGGEGW